MTHAGGSHAAGGAARRPAAAPRAPATGRGRSALEHPVRSLHRVARPRHARPSRALGGRQSSRGRADGRRRPRVRDARRPRLRPARRREAARRTRLRTPARPDHRRRIRDRTPTRSSARSCARSPCRPSSTRRRAATDTPERRQVAIYVACIVALFATAWGQVRRPAVGVRDRDPLDRVDAVGAFGPEGRQRRGRVRAGEGVHRRGRHAPRSDQNDKRRRCRSSDCWSASRSACSPRRRRTRQRSMATASGCRSPGAARSSSACPWSSPPAASSGSSASTSWSRIRSTSPRSSARPRRIDPLLVMPEPARWGSRCRSRGGCRSAPPRPSVRLFEDREHFAGVRDYEPGDPMHHVHWRLSAHAGELQTKTYEPTRSAEVLFALDLSNGEPFWHGPTRHRGGDDRHGRRTSRARRSTPGGGRGWSRTRTFAAGAARCACAPRTRPATRPCCSRRSPGCRTSPRATSAPVLREVGRRLVRRTTVIVVSPSPGAALSHEMEVLRRRGCDVIHLSPLEAFREAAS